MPKLVTNNLSKYTFFFDEAIVGVQNIDSRGCEWERLTTHTYANILLDNFNLFNSQSDDLSQGTKENLQTIEGRLVPNLAQSESIGAHFSHMGWSSFQDMIDDGYTKLGQPFHDSSSYVTKIFDIGAIVSSAKITGVLDQTPVDEPVGVEWVIKTSPDQTTWTNHVGVSATFAQNVKYVQFELIFVPSDKTFTYLDSVSFKILSEELKEVGTTTIDQSDVDGTEINLSKPFADIANINVNPINIDAREMIIFNDQANPTKFKVKLLDPSNGNLLTGLVKWSVIGS